MSTAADEWLALRCDQVGRRAYDAHHWRAFHALHCVGRAAASNLDDRHRALGDVAVSVEPEAPEQAVYDARAEVQDTGRITMTLDTRIASFVAGPHEAFFGGGLDAVACQAMAAA